MLRFILRRCEIQVMGDIMILIGSAELDLHVEFSPSLFLDSKRWVVECFFSSSALRFSCLSFHPPNIHTLNGPIPKTRMQRVRHLVEYIGRNLLPSIIKQINLNRPWSERESFNAGIFVTVWADRVGSAKAVEVELVKLMKLVKVILLLSVYRIMRHSCRKTVNA